MCAALLPRCSHYFSVEDINLKLEQNSVPEQYANIKYAVSILSRHDNGMSSDWDNGT